ncbi:LysR family transcriptional regulator [Paenibacillus sp. BC26]|uniref:LysR family transcriptional regulator n=1 Tax=Paenibacillus sp. BC26 TaxID=1881032 RepID=UPI0008E39E36|nr:LysR family transcriptional regulator [Paenibacillus sp. BC26]SFS71104.1 DNA-binding transcriptional regulator, LysR family [Paenibacillus sp. BC26]
MDLTYFQTFREVAFHQSYTKAAGELGYAQSSVTMQIQKLEQMYGVKLFERFGRGLRLTLAGEELLKISVQMLNLFEQSKGMLAVQGGGIMTIGTIDSLASYYLPPFIQHMRERYPALTIRIQPDREAAIVEKVREGEYDLGLLLENKPAHSPLAWTAIREEPLVLVTGAGHPYAAVEAINLAHLQDAEWLMSEPSCNYRMMLERVLQEQGISYRVGLELGNPEAIKRCLKAGSGIALLPRMAVQEEIDRGELAVLPFSHADIRLDLQLILHPKKWISHALQDLIELLH